MRYEEDVKIYTQEICLNGHQIDISSESNEDPNPPIYCEICGEKTIRTCQNCHEVIDGRRQYPNVYGMVSVSIPSYCRSCGKPYPWTETVLASATELIALDTDLSSEDKDLIKSAIPDLIVDTPKTQVAAAKYQIVMSKATKFVKDGLYNLLVDVASETAKKIIFPS